MEKMVSNLRICVLMATFNGASYLREQLDSILAQIGPQISIYISDDGSTDSTPEILEDFARQFPARIFLLPPNTRGRGACSNFFYLMQNVDSDLYLLADQDDLWMPDHVQSLYERYRNLSNAKQALPTLLFSDMKIITSDGRLLTHSFLNAENLPNDAAPAHFYFMQNNVSGCVTLFNQALKNYVLKNPDLLWQNLSKIPMHDAFLATTAAIFGNIYFVRKALSLYRHHDKNTVGVQDITSHKHIFERLKHQSDDIKRSMQYAEFFAKYFEQELKAGELKILQEFAHLESKSKIQRILFMLRHQFLKAGSLRRCVQLWNA